MVFKVYRYYNLLQIWSNPEKLYDIAGPFKAASYKQKTNQIILYQLLVYITLLTYYIKNMQIKTLLNKIVRFKFGSLQLWLFCIYTISLFSFF